MIIPQRPGPEVRGARPLGRSGLYAETGAFSER